VTAGDFAAWAARLGLTRLSEDDLETLRAGWIGLQPQLSLIRASIGPDDRPPRPPLGVAR
jgi:hypothetical protein